MPDFDIEGTGETLIEDAKNLFSGDIEIGGKKIPKVILIGGVVGVIVLLLVLRKSSRAGGALSANPLSPSSVSGGTTEQAVTDSSAFTTSALSDVQSNLEQQLAQQNTDLTSQLNQALADAQQQVNDQLAGIQGQLSQTPYSPYETLPSIPSLPVDQLPSIGAIPSYRDNGLYGNPELGLNTTIRDTLAPSRNLTLISSVAKKLPKAISVSPSIGLDRPPKKTPKAVAITGKTPKKQVKGVAIAPSQPKANVPSYSVINFNPAAKPTIPVSIPKPVTVTPYVKPAAVKAKTKVAYGGKKK